MKLDLNFPARREKTKRFAGGERGSETRKGEGVEEKQEIKERNSF